MDEGGFVVCGSRPPSVLSSHRPSSSQGKHHGYHTVSRQSSVDESLFGSHHQTKINEAIVDFKAPWEHPKPKKPGNTFVVNGTKPKCDKNKPPHRPLLWSPAPGSSLYVKKKKGPSDQDTHYLWNTRDTFRTLKHTPTFVDESLFGSKLEEPSFKAPWNEKKKGEKRPMKPYLWDPSGDSGIQSHNGIQVDFNKDSKLGFSPTIRRPASAPGFRRGQKRDASNPSPAVPIWKP